MPNDALVLELQRKAMIADGSVGDLLRLAFVVAHKLDATEFKKWIENELNGYKDPTEIPSYRTMTGELMCRNPFHGWCPVIISDSEKAKAFTQRPTNQPITEIEMLSKSAEPVEMQLPSSLRHKIMQGMDVNLAPSLILSTSSLHGVLDTVRNTVLRWSLALETQGVLGKDMMFTSEERQRGQIATNIYISNFNGVLGEVSDNSTVQTIHVVENDWGSLSENLVKFGIEKEDIESLKVALDSDPKPNEKAKFGEKVSSWMGKMIGKAASGAWTITMDVASEVLQKAITKYYGIS